MSPVTRLGSGITLVKNYGENAELADAFARSGTFTPQNEVIGGMMVEMKMTHHALETHPYRQKQCRDQSQGFKLGGNPKHKGTGHKL